MKKIALTSILLGFLIPLHNAAALEATCELIMKANQVSMNTPTWQKISTLTSKKDFKVEIRKVDGQYYSFINNAWRKQDASFNAIVESFDGQVRSGKIKLSDCKEEGSEIIDGVDTTVISYHVEMSGGPATNAKVYIGKADGLPYADSSVATQSRYSYKDVVVPIH
jgi:hypothetical protein